MTTTSEKKWYQKNLSIIALLILFFPAGLFLMWRYSNWNKIVKIVVTLFFVILVLSGAFNDDTKRTVDTDKTPQPVISSPKPTEKPAASTEPTRYELNATIKFSEVAFLITNNEDRNWSGCKLELNSGLLKGGYSYTNANIPAKDSLIVQFREFTKGDGTRFNSNDMKAQNLSISCDDVAGKHGFGYFGIE